MLNFSAAGAYIFKPNGTEGMPGPLSFTVVEGPVVSEVHQHWTNYTSLTARCACFVWVRRTLRLGGGVSGKGPSCWQLQFHHCTGGMRPHAQPVLLRTLAAAFQGIRKLCIAVPVSLQTLPWGGSAPLPTHHCAWVPATLPQQSMGSTCRHRHLFGCRIWKDALHVELEWTVGPIPFRDGRGREVSLRFQSSLDSGALHDDAPRAMYTCARCTLHLDYSGLRGVPLETLLCLSQILHVMLHSSR